MTAKAYALQIDPPPAPGPVSAIKSLARSGLKAVLPAPWFWRFLAHRIGQFDVELRLLPYLCDPKKASVDVGASTGSYTVHLLNHSAKCHAFEPIPESGAFLMRRLTARPHRRLRVENVALSDCSGEARLKVMTTDTGRSTIEAANEVERAGAVELLTVPTRRLDDYADAIGPVGCVKIDVEGHEEAVLRGATRILSRDRPSLIIEIEERHKPGSLTRVRNMLGELGYRGFFFRGGRLWPVESFSAEKHQDITTIETRVDGECAYVNNFLFFAPGSLKRVSHLVATP